MSKRFYVDRPITGPVAELIGAEAHHVAKVMRLGTKSRLVLFDGSGREFEARIDRMEKDGLVERLRSKTETGFRDRIQGGYSCIRQ